MATATKARRKKKDHRKKPRRSRPVPAAAKVQKKGGQMMYIIGPIGQLVYRERMAQGMTQQELADKAGCHKSTVRNCEEGNDSVSWGWMRTRLGILNALGYQLIAMEE